MFLVSRRDALFGREVRGHFDDVGVFLFASDFLRRLFRTRASERPFTTTFAPSSAKSAAMAKPIPAVEPVTSTLLFASCKSMPRTLLLAPKKTKQQPCHFRRVRTAGVQKASFSVEAI